jgi:hypothetical protein
MERNNGSVKALSKTLRLAGCMMIKLDRQRSAGRLSNRTDEDACANRGDLRSQRRDGIPTRVQSNQVVGVEEPVTLPGGGRA